jgi:hypothetical protein
MNPKFCSCKRASLLANQILNTPYHDFHLTRGYTIIAAVPDTKTGINQTLTVPNPDFVRSHGKYRDRYVVIVIINKY